MSKRKESRNWGIKEVLIFILLNIFIIAVFTNFFIDPSLQGVNRARNNLSMMEHRYLASARLAVAYEDNLNALRILNEERQLLGYDELASTFSKISSAATDSNLRELIFFVGEPMGFDFYELEKFVELRLRVENEGYIWDVFKFLQELGNLPVNILDIVIVWESHVRTRISVEMSIVSELI